MLADTTNMVMTNECGQEYEVDELRTFVGNKKNECWVMYAINKTTKQVIDFAVGRRTKENIRKVIDTLNKLHPKRIFSDQLNIYSSLIDRSIHSTRGYGINHIERMNLNLRKDIKCLNRKTICYAKSEMMLEARLNLYFFGKERMPVGA